jgi:DNA-binding beta-propeller fold protein YncE
VIERPVEPVAAERPTVLIGPERAGSQPLADARGLAVLANGEVLIVETASRLVARFGPDGQRRGQIGGPGTGDGQFGEPVAIAIDRSGALHVLDAQPARVQVFDAGGAYRFTYAADRGLYGPRGLTLGSDGLLYLADTGGNRILRFREDGQLVDSLPAQPASRPPLLDQPTAAVERAGVIYVAEPNRGLLSQIDSAARPNGPAWTLAATDTVRSTRLSIGPAGQLLIADVGGQAIQLGCPGQERLLEWQPSTNEVAELRGAVLAPDGRLFVIDAAGRLLVTRLLLGCTG